MVRVSVLGPGTPGGNMILQDFLNYKVTGFSPFEQVGGVDHWRSRPEYQKVSQASFRSQAKKIAKIAMDQLDATRCLDGNEVSDKSTGGKERGKNTNKNTISNKENNPSHSDNNNDRSDSNNKGDDNNNSIGDDDDDGSIDESYSSNDGDDDSGSEITNYEFDGEDSLLNRLGTNQVDQQDDTTVESLFSGLSLNTSLSIHDPIICPYPTGDKVFVAFETDGDVDDMSSNQFTFSNDRRRLERWSRVPAERVEASKFLKGTLVPGMNSLFDIDCITLQAEMNKRLQGLERDQNGNYWELRNVFELPFVCRPIFYNKMGAQVLSFSVFTNTYGYTWGYIWLIGEHVEENRFQGNRFGGRKVRPANPFA